MSARTREIFLRTIRILLPVLVGLLGAWIGMHFWGRQSVWMGPFHVEISSGFGRGVTDVRLPPLGELTADTHRAPLRFGATLREVRVPELASAIGERGIDQVVDEVEREALSQVTPFALRLLGAAVAGSLLLSLLVFRLRWRPGAMAVLAAVVAVGGSETAAWRTYHPSKLLSPTFSGSLSLAPKLIGPAATAIDRIDNFRAELARVVSGAIRVYGSIQEQPIGLTNEIKVLHISDIHLSPLGLDFARELAAAFDVDLILDTGDLTSFGTPAEEAILPVIRRFGRPYVFVRGNHDSFDLQQALARIRGAVVLDGDVRRVRGLAVYGLGDPVFTPDKASALNEADIAASVASVGERIARDVQGLPGPPDIVAVHDDRMAAAVAGFVPVVISGHFHRPSARVESGTLFLRVGSTGGAGAGVFTRAGGIPLQAEVLYFERGNPPVLVAYDLIVQSPESGSLTVKRHLIAEEFGPLIPTPPSPSPSPFPSVSQ